MSSVQWKNRKWQKNAIISKLTIYSMLWKKYCFSRKIESGPVDAVTEIING